MTASYLLIMTRRTQTYLLLHMLPLQEDRPLLHHSWQVLVKQHLHLGDHALDLLAAASQADPTVGLRR